MVMYNKFKTFAVGKVSLVSFGLGLVKALLGALVLYHKIHICFGQNLLYANLVIVQLV